MLMIIPAFLTKDKNTHKVEMIDKTGTGEVTKGLGAVMGIRMSGFISQRYGRIRILPFSHISVARTEIMLVK
jgi:hypothetical protein